MTYPRNRVKTQPEAEAVDATLAKSHLGIFHSEDDTLIAFYCKAARRHVESGITGRSLVNQTFQAWWNSFPCEYHLELPYPRLQSVTHLKYTDSTGTVTTWSSSNYFLDDKSEPGRLMLVPDASWPSATLYPANGVEVEYVAGYGAAADDVPEDIRNAILLLVGHLYKHKEEVVLGNAASAESKLIAFGAKNLLADYRVY